MTTQYKNHSRKRTPWDCNTSLSPMETFIKSKYLDSYDYKHTFIKETMEADLLNSYEVTCCKRCASTDFKKKGGYQRSIQLSKEYSLYRQNFCGCVFSKKENEDRKKSEKPLA